MTKYSGNIVPEVTADEHDEILSAKRVSMVSATTIHAVVNTAAAGQASVTIDGPVDTELPAAVAMDDSLSNPTAPAVASHIVGWTGSNWRRIWGIAADDTTGNNAGLLTVGLGMVWNGSSWSRAKGDATDGTLVNLGTNNDVVLNAGANYIGLVSTASIHGKVDFATAHTMNHVAIAANTSGLATIFVPTSTFKVTHLMLSANATVGVRINSGATYLIGNASVNMTLFPGGGFVENGQIANPVYIGATSGDAFILDLDDSVEVAGKVIYYEE